MLSQNLAADIFYQAGLGFHPLLSGKEISIIFAFDETHILAFRFFNGFKAFHLCQSNNIGFFHMSNRKSGAGQMLLGQSGQKVGLVFFGINALIKMKLTMVIFFYPCIVSGCQG